jgi:hypothetical protein
MSRKYFPSMGLIYKILCYCLFIIAEDPVKKKGAQFTEELRIVVWRPVYSNYGAAKSPGMGLLPSSILFRQISRSCGKSNRLTPLAG